MKDKIYKIVFAIVIVSAWINLLVSATEYMAISQPVTWDAIKVLIDLSVALCWSMLLMWKLRRKDDSV